MIFSMICSFTKSIFSLLIVIFFHDHVIFMISYEEQVHELRQKTKTASRDADLNTAHRCSSL